MNLKQDYDSYEIEEPSDEEEAASSSEDELDILLNGTPDQKRKLIREYLTGESESSSGDEFEKEMEAELTKTMKTLEDSWTSSSAQGQSSGTSGATLNTRQTQEYDSIYFDSDEDQDETAGSSQGRRRKQRSVLTNDELLYDPDEDERDQAWVDAQRKRYRNQRQMPQSANRKKNKTQTLPSSDAVLNCPACMSTLCLDCQRHETYRTQYRAMFVMNCTVNKEEVLRYKTVSKRKQNRRRKKARLEPAAAAEAEMETGAGLTDERLAGMDEDEIYHPVKCTECSTEVAVYDKDEVYHFFNILASYS